MSARPILPQLVFFGCSLLLMVGFATGEVLAQQPCSESDPAVCDGDCPAGQQCLPDGTGGPCRCLPTTIPCEQSPFPECGGTCPSTDLICTAPPGAANCECLPVVQDCEQGPFPECGGECPPDQVCTDDAALNRCVCVPIVVPCEQGPFPVCDGECPADQVCTADTANNACVCEPIVIPCEQSPFPECGGECPPDQACTANAELNECVCEPIVVACDQSPFPVCDGECPADQVCEPIAGADTCRCVPIVVPCEQSPYPTCDGECPADQVCDVDASGLDNCGCVPIGQECSQCGPGPHFVDQCGPFPPVGTDLVANNGAVVGIDVDLDCVRDVNLVLRPCPAPDQLLHVDKTLGPIDDSVNFPGTSPVDGHPTGPGLDVIDTEIVSLCLTNGAVTLAAGAGGPSALPLQPSLGAVAEDLTSPDPAFADSFFDVFFEVSGIAGGPVYNQTALQVQSRIDCLPPAASYRHPVGICVPLTTRGTCSNDGAPCVVDQDCPGGTCDGTQILANLVSANHSVNQPVCDLSPFPECGGDCPPDQECLPAQDGTDACRCEPIQPVACEQGPFPECGGECPPDQECTANAELNECVCEPIVVACDQSPFPVCDGECPPDTHCDPTGTTVNLPSPDLPPEPNPPGCDRVVSMYEGQDVHALFPGGIDFSNPQHKCFQNVVTTTEGQDEFETFDSVVEGVVDLGGGPTPVQLSGPVATRVFGKADQTTGSWDTEIVSMSLSGDVGGIPVEVRESPTLASQGRTTITDNSDGTFHIDSFFDVFTELSVDGGPFEPQVNPPGRLSLVPVGGGSCECVPDLLPCDLSDPAVCDGFCPNTTDVCTPDSEGGPCFCAPPPVECELSDPATCDGLCPDPNDVCTPQTSPILPSPELPPESQTPGTPDCDQVLSQYEGRDVHALFPGGIDFSDPQHKCFINVNRQDDGAGNEIETFDSTVDAQVDLGGGPVPVSVGGPVTVVTYGKTGHTTGTFATEMVSMSLTGDVAGVPVEIRESPSLASTGQTTITDLGGGQWQIDSFFDVFTELSVDGGPFQPQTNPAGRMTLAPTTPNPCECLPAACDLSDPAVCDGLCPNATDVCTPDSTGGPCFCAPVVLPCEQSPYPECGGECPADQVCEPDASGLDSCACVPIGQECSQCGPGPHFVDQCGPFPPIGTDLVADNGALVGIDVDMDCVRDVSLVLHPCPAPDQLLHVDKTLGPIDDSVNFPGTSPVDGHPTGPGLDVIDTEIVALCLTDGSVTLAAGAGSPSAMPLQPSLGAVAEDLTSPDPAVADSFFDVFFEVSGIPGGPVYNQTPLPVHGRIECLPPATGYRHPVGICIPLTTRGTCSNDGAPCVVDQDCTDGTCLGTQRVANLVSALHTVNVPVCNNSPYPECGGECPPEEECRPALDGTDECRCEPIEPVACEQSPFPVCDGECPPDQVCEPIATADVCLCVPIVVPCEQSPFPECGGECPPDQFCTEDPTGVAACVCEPIPVPCEQGPFPECGGECPPDQFCTEDPTGVADCVCEPIPVPCEQGPFPECGGECPPDQVCRSDPELNECVCEPIVVDCEASPYPTCDGECPPDQICLRDPDNEACVCEPIVVPCEESPFPECDGECPPDLICDVAPDGIDECRCVPPPVPCDESSPPVCDGFCPDPQQETCVNLPGTDVCDCRPCLVNVPGHDIDLRFVSRDQIRWIGVPCAFVYNVYRFAGQRHVDANGDGLADDYGSCLLPDLLVPTAVDTAIPPSGSLLAYLVTGESSVGEGSLGFASNMAQRPNNSPCP